MKLSLRKTTLVAAVLMSLCLLRSLFRGVIHDLLLEGHPIRTIVFNDMIFCVVAMAIALFFWGIWMYRDEMPRLEKRSVIGMVCLGVIVVACYILRTIVLTNWVVTIERLAMAVGLWYYYALLGTEGVCEKGLDRYNSHYYALLIAVVMSVAAVALVVSDALWYCVSASLFAAWHMGAGEINFLAIVPFVLWLCSLAMPVFETVAIGKDSGKMVFTNRQQVVAKISFWVFVVSVITMFCIRLGLFGYSYRYETGGFVLFLYGILFICWLYSAIHSVRKGEESWLKRFNRYGLWALVALVALVSVLFGICQYLQYETDLLENDVVSTIFMGTFFMACILVFLFVFVGWICNTFIVFLSTKAEDLINDERLRKIKRVALWGGLLFLMVLVINAVVKYEVGKRQQEKRESVDVYRLSPGDLQYSDSIIINTWRENKVYNINTKKYLHEEEINDILHFDMVAESKIVYINSVYNRGYLNVVTGEIDIKAEYDHAWLFSEGVAAVVKDNKIGFIDKDNNVVIPFQYPMYASYAPYTYRFYSGYCKMTDEEGRCGLIDHSGKWVIEPKYQRIKKPVFGKYRKVKLNDKWGLLDENLKLILPLKYDHITVLDSMATRFEVTYEGKMYELDRSGKLLKQIDYSYMHPFYEPKGRYGSLERTSGRYMQVWVRQEDEVDCEGGNYKFSVENNLEDCGLCFRTGIIDVLENKVVVPIEYCKIVFDNLPKEIDVKKSLVFKCIGPYKRSCWYAEEDTDWITLDGKKVRVKYE